MQRIIKKVFLLIAIKMNVKLHNSNILKDIFLSINLLKMFLIIVILLTINLLSVILLNVVLISVILFFNILTSVISLCLVIKLSYFILPPYFKQSVILSSAVLVKGAPRH